MVLLVGLQQQIFIFFLNNTHFPVSCFSLQQQIFIFFLNHLFCRYTRNVYNSRYLFFFLNNAFISHTGMSTTVDIYFFLKLKNKTICCISLQQQIFIFFLNRYERGIWICKSTTVDIYFFLKQLISKLKDEVYNSRYLFFFLNIKVLDITGDVYNSRYLFFS